MTCDACSERGRSAELTYAEPASGTAGLRCPACGAWWACLGARWFRLMPVATPGRADEFEDALDEAFGPPVSRSSASTASRWRPDYAPPPLPPPDYAPAPAAPELIPPYPPAS